MINIIGSDFTTLDINSVDSRFEGRIFVHVHLDYAIKRSETSHWWLSSAAEWDYSIGIASDAVNKQNYSAHLYFTNPDHDTIIGEWLDKISVGEETLLNLVVPIGSCMYRADIDRQETITSDRKLNISKYINGSEASEFHIYLYPASYTSSTQPEDITEDIQPTAYDTSYCNLNSETITEIKKTIAAREASNLIGWDGISVEYQALLTRCEPEYAQEKKALSQAAATTEPDISNSKIWLYTKLLIFIVALFCVIYLVAASYTTYRSWYND